MRDKQLLNLSERSEQMSLLPTFDIHSRQQFISGEKVRMRGAQSGIDRSEHKFQITNCLLIVLFITACGCGNSQQQDMSNEPSSLNKSGNASGTVLRTRNNDPDELDSNQTNQVPTEQSTSLESVNQRARIDSTLAPIQFDQNVIAAFEKLSKPVDSFEEWDQANQGFLALGEATIPLLAHKLTEGDQVERELAASTLVLMGTPPEAALPALVEALSDTLPFVRANAAATLVQFPQHQQIAIPVLVQFLNHTDPNLQQMASVNLTALGEEASPHVAELTTLLESKTSEPEVLLPVVQLLGRIGPKAELAIPKLKQIAFEQQGEVGDAAKSAIQLIETAVE